MYELIIIGGGPGAVAGGVYAARKKIKTLFITDGFGGQSLVSWDIQNWVGTKSVSGFDFAKMLEEHLRAQEGIEIIDTERVSRVIKKDGGFQVDTETGKKFEAKTVLIASGSHHKKLGVTGEEKFNGRGVVYCSTCDAPLFKDKTVAVVGGGNSALEAVVDLKPYAAKIYLMVRSDKLRGDDITQEKVRISEQVETIFNAETKEILGGEFVTGIKYNDKTTGLVKELKLDGVFVAVGASPNSDFVKGLVNLNEYGEIVVDHKTQKTSVSGIWAAGDVTDVLYKQNNVSAGDAVKAILGIHSYLHKNGSFHSG